MLKGICLGDWQSRGALTKDVHFFCRVLSPPTSSCGSSTGFNTVIYFILFYFSVMLRISSLTSVTLQTWATRLICSFSTKLNSFPTSVKKKKSFFSAGSRDELTNVGSEIQEVMTDRGNEGVVTFGLNAEKRDLRKHEKLNCTTHTDGNIQVITVLVLWWWML